VEPDEPFLGTVRLEALPYRHLRPADFYPYGGPADPFAEAADIRPNAAQTRPSRA
jgi:hypothetical protein